MRPSTSIQKLKLEIPEQEVGGWESVRLLYLGSMLYKHPQQGGWWSILLPLFHAFVCPGGQPRSSPLQLLPAPGVQSQVETAASRPADDLRRESADQLVESKRSQRWSTHPALQLILPVVSQNKNTDNKSTCCLWKNPAEQNRVLRIQNDSTLKIMRKK